MSKQVQWTRDTLDRFIKYAMLNAEEIYIMESRIKNVPISRQAMELNRSESWVHKCISMLKKKYDAAQLQHPEEMPIRKTSAKETWMDTH